MSLCVSATCWQRLKRNSKVVAHLVWQIIHVPHQGLSNDDYIPLQLSDVHLRPTCANKTANKLWVVDLALFWSRRQKKLEFVCCSTPIAIVQLSCCVTCSPFTLMFCSIYTPAFYICFLSVSCRSVVLCMCGLVWRLYVYSGIHVVMLSCQFCFKLL